MIMCTGFNCILCIALSSVLVTPAQKQPFYKLSTDIVQDVVLCPKSWAAFLLPHFKF